MTHVRNAAMALVVLLLLVAGAWSSWDTAQHVLLSKGREHGTLTVTGCNEETCSGRYVPDVPGSAHHTLTIAHSVAAQKGQTLPVVVKPGTGEAVRSGWGGGLHAWLPLGGALLLAAPLVGGGLRMARTGWSVAGAGAALLLGAFFAL
ncbi:hypothetical protein [Streptomyces roseicoloratus]|uniref:Uncharacterized protein n=1 Tax=Streptomyces roseicoloratus TaxID=2508722 RepID=A0ABY9RX99_9ACTN|nr:hypothetical protein [Streptomyces roseicoloratus]WMX46640.1 hypothetical protein RGF97_19895 [Streptomyces roseicoloratus]